MDRLFATRYGPGVDWVDATPSNTLVCGDLVELFPDAKFVNIVRDGRAVVSSMLRSGFDSAFASDFRVACRTWVHYVRAGLAFVSRHPTRAITVRHEELVATPDQEMAHIFEFLGLETCAASADFLRKGHINSSYGNEAGLSIRDTKPLDAVPQAPWSDWTETERRSFMKEAGDTQADLGYQPP